MSTPVDQSPDQSPNEPDPKAELVAYTVPHWSGPPRNEFSIQILKDGLIIDKFNVHDKGHYVFGTTDLCDFILDDPTISPFHAVLQFKSEGAAYIYDLSSKHGTSVNNKQVNQKEYVELHVGDVIQFGGSPKLYVLEGPIDLISPGNSNEEECAMEVATQEKQDQLAASLNDLFISVSTMVKGELQGTNNLLELLEKMNLRVAEEYKGFGDLASGLSVFVEQLKSKSNNFDDYVQQIDAIENQVTECEVVISMLDRYVSVLESKVQSAYQIPPHS
ncbi:hypothetical protein Leryth_005405 [Lithospermum erythrorhizon]|nr:hypothetical protein Leryth_005405 [Lithospermum erythrorhizon]